MILNHSITWSAALDWNQVPRIEFTVVKHYPHDTEAFTQGLLYLDGRWYESTGKWGESTLREFTLPDGKVKRLQHLPEAIFAEGLAALDGQLYQLSWKARKAFVYQADDFSLLKTLNYTGQGWGLTANDEHLIMSDGSSRLAYRDPESFAVLRAIKVHTEEAEVDKINELEWIKGSIYANIWKQPYIIRIHPETGKVQGLLDLSAIVKTIDHPHVDGVLNGIAYWPERETLLVTGKWWPLMFELKVQE